MLRQPPRTVAQATAVDEPHTTATDTVREDTNTQKEAMFDKPGGHARELNKFWKANGTGMPEAAQATATKREAMMRSMEADRHKHTHATKGPALSWRQKALARLKSKDSQSQIDSGRTDTTVESDTGQAVIMATHSANESSVSNANELATSMSNSLRNRMRATVRKVSEATADHSDTLKSTEDNTTESQSTETPAEQPVEPEMFKKVSECV
ncbi:hypothetical protein SARC_02302 [Sphaeroforma arctica JP610]|uniref:Uncharacterized protein n=1 Tax=Sphaeroforma arctica JP610 TaxID=667725 RepID=A0A0L0G9H9_9EUKA|nr:hypothetical protein SARC_02302 [Sphaeroforma arctica JP610]KNC85541.1 hypothetical protein SARC_02302 [Sphaeroforma arctica JP610]|eukprot:XP_014159443.1 hypothetical protein SARC_02302 [Sphaeroforma arctica JP610]